MSTRQKVLIVGGGFGGVRAALDLASQPMFEVSLMSDQSDFRYYPQLYHTATGGNSLAAAIPLAEIFKGRAVILIKDGAEKLDRQKQVITGSSGKHYGYDLLVLALGVVTNYFGIKGLEEHSYGIKSLDQAKRFRGHLHKLLADQNKPDINYVVIGGGPTGVELAGALPAYIHSIMARHGISGNVHVDLVEAAPRLMPRMPRRYSAAVKRRLHKLGVKLYLGQTVEAETADGLMVSGHSIDSHSVVWTAGVTNHPFFKTNDFKLSDHGKVMVNPYLAAEPNVYVIGDNADTEFSGMAQTALYDGRFVAENLRRTANSQQPRAYKAKRPIYITPVGSGWAAVLWGKFQLYGRLAWWLRSIADLIAYHDLEPWWPAGKHWRASAEAEEDCPICQKN